jgi:single-strand DNA-binding protein
VNCTAWQKTGVFVNTYFKKGDGITIDGRLESRKYVDKDGNNRTAWEVVCDNVEFPLSKPSGSSTGQGDYAEPEFAEINEVDGDLPF